MLLWHLPIWSIWAFTCRAPSPTQTQTGLLRLWCPEESKSEDVAAVGVTLCPLGPSWSVCSGWYTVAMRCKSCKRHGHCLQCLLSGEASENPLPPIRPVIALQLPCSHPSKAAAGDVADPLSSEQLAAFLRPGKATRESTGGRSVSSQVVPASRLQSQILLHRPLSVKPPA